MSLIKCFPPIIDRALPINRYATNHRFYIEADLARIHRQGQSIAGILCQERFEFGHKWRHLFDGVDRVKLELMGHAIEACVAALHLGAPYHEYEVEEARALTYPGVYKQFAGWTQETALASLKMRRPAALAWTLDHDGFVKWAVALEKRYERKPA